MPEIGSPTGAATEDREGGSLPAELAGYLDALDSSFNLPEPFRSEAREEIAGHLADTAAELESGGLAPADAVREAIRRLGPADELGREITRSRQTQRALLAGVGSGVWAATGGAFRGFVFGLALVVAVAFSVALALRGLQVTGLAAVDPSTLFRGQPKGTTATAIALWFAAWPASRALVSGVSQRSYRRAERVRRWLAVAGGLIVVALAIFWLRGAQDGVSVLALTAVPCIFVAGALTANDRPLRPPTPMLLFVTAWLLVLSALALLLGGAQVGKTLTAVGSGPFTFSSMEELLRSRNMDLPGRFVPDGLVGDVSSSVTDGIARVSLQAPSGFAATRWHDIRLEAWRSVDLPTLDRRFSSPFATAQFVLVNDRLEASLRIDSTRDVEYYWLVVTGVAADGRRDLLREVTGSNTSFVGTAWDWLTAD